jgi:hypothetical protein
MFIILLNLRFDNYMEMVNSKRTNVSGDSSSDAVRVGRDMHITYINLDVDVDSQYIAIAV